MGRVEVLRSESKGGQRWTLKEITKIVVPTGTAVLRTKELLRSKYLNHRNSRRKLKKEEIESGVQLQLRESEKEDSGLLNCKTNIKFVICSQH